jgi:hypothetical protein
MTRRQTIGAVRHRSAEPCPHRQMAPPGMTPDPRDRGFRSIQVEHAGSAECILRRSMRWGCSAGLRPAPAPSWSNSNSRSNSRSRFHVGSRGGSGSGRRRKPVPGGLAAASVPRPSPQGRTCGVPAIRHRPAKTQTTQSRFGFGFGFGFGLCPGFGRCRAPPCRPTLPCARKRFHCFQQTVTALPRQYHIAQQHAPTGDPC